MRAYAAGNTWISAELFEKGNAPLRDLAGGARGRNRTADTMIFSHVLYQLSYPGVAAAAVGAAPMAKLCGLGKG